VRQEVRRAEKKWKHPILLAARVPARPEISLGTGLDAISWARRGLVDHLIVAPFFTTTDYDIPVEHWRGLLQGTGVGVTAGLETRVQPYPGGPTLPNTAERRRGAALAALARGSQGIYLFNYFEIGSQMPYLFQELDSVETLLARDRTYTVTFTDISIPGKPIPPFLPRKLKPGESAEFLLFVGPKPLPGTKSEVQLTLVPEKTPEKYRARVMLNGIPSTEKAFTFGPEVFREGYNTIRVANAGKVGMTIERVELALRVAGIMP
jgi:hypothetical protein